MKRARADAGPAVFVWSVWLGLSLLLTYFVLAYSFPHAEDGRHLAGVFRQTRQAAVADVRNGVPLPEVASRHCGNIYVCGTDTLARRMQMLRDKKIGPFALPSE